MRLYRKCTNISYKNVYNKILKGSIIKKIFTLALLLAPIFSFSSWVIVNDDGTTNIYISKDKKPYTAPIKKRKVAQKKNTKKEKKTDKIMYLTFDDGPLLGSNNIISVLQEEHVEGTMFMVGKHIEHNKYRKKIFNRALQEPLIQVANHTYTHANGRYRHFYSDANRVVSDVQRMDDILFNNDPEYVIPCCRLAGRNVWRTPNINRNDPGIPKKYRENEKYDALSDAGYQIYGWDYQWSYNPKNGEVDKSPQTIANNIERIYKKNRTRAKGKFVLLMHDFSFRDKFDGKEQLRTLIQTLKYHGWRFEKLSTYL